MLKIESSVNWPLLKNSLHADTDNGDSRRCRQNVIEDEPEILAIKALLRVERVYVARIFAPTSRDVYSLLFTSIFVHFRVPHFLCRFPASSLWRCLRGDGCTFG